MVGTGLDVGRAPVRLALAAAGQPDSRTSLDLEVVQVAAGPLYPAGGVQFGKETNEHAESLTSAAPNGKSRGASAITIAWALLMLALLYS